MVIAEAVWPDSQEPMIAGNDPIPSFARQQAAMQIVERLRTAGHAAYFAGGCVRDLLLGREPSDFDVATSATPDVVLKMFPRTFAVGASFGVVLVATDISGEQQDIQEIVTEVATFRSDGAYSDGRRPDSVRYSTSPEADVRRRGFTISGMLLVPAALAASGEVQAAV